ncbi:MAG TPA: alpha/beta family hydrolase [Solirubrobacteraceae bacterium]|nr:alpha/beta family hydrolase [Solirubrobacteraceae bacterium]
MEIDTPHGPARAHLHEVDAPRGILVLGHGAGGGVGAPDLVAATRAANGEGFGVVLVEQPYRVAGRRSVAPARQLDAAWEAVLAALPFEGLPVVTGGRSSGARVACRTAAATGAAGVLCLAFPLVTPRGASRQEELDAVEVPMLVVQGRSDRFGMPKPGPRREVVQVDGDHGLKKDLAAVGAAVGAFLRRIAQEAGTSSRRSASKRSPSTRQS